MKTWIVRAPVDCEGVYHVEAPDQEEALRRFLLWDGSDGQVVFLHYSKEYPTSDVEEITIEENT